MPPKAQREMPTSAKGVGNAGVTVVGFSSKHGDVPAVLLGGRFYTGKRQYLYTDFGGGVNRSTGESLEQGAFREFAEELLAMGEKEAMATAQRLGDATASQLVGGRPFIHRSSYAMFVVRAEEVVDALCLPGAEHLSAIDVLFEAATHNSELTSIALVAVDELLRGGLSDGKVQPLDVRQLDGQQRSSSEIFLRAVLMGMGGSISTISAALSGFTEQLPARRPAAREAVVPTAAAKDAYHKASRNADHIEPGASTSSPSRESPVDAARLPTATGSQQQKTKTRRWGGTCAKATGAGDSVPASTSAVEASASTAEASTNPTVCRAAGTAGAVEARASAAATHAGAQADADAAWNATRPVPFVFDMETGDPDDVLTLVFLCSHPNVELRAVTITPGSQEQVALVRWILKRMGMAHVRLGAQAWPQNAKKHVDLRSDFYRAFGRLPAGEPACEPADRVLRDCCDERVTLVTGAPLHNLGDALKLEGFRLGRWVAQGGFAGEGVVPREKQLEKFTGKVTCPTWNFGGNIQAAEAALASTAIARKVCVSKNVCHGVFYDQEWHRALGAAAASEAAARPQGQRAQAFQLMHGVMDEYLRRRPGGKKLHDPLALAVALDESVCELAEVHLYCQKGQWGSSLCPGTDVWISVDYDAAKFQAALLH